MSYGDFYAQDVGNANEYSGTTQDRYNNYTRWVQRSGGLDPASYAFAKTLGIPLPAQKAEQRPAQETEQPAAQEAAQLAAYNQGRYGGNS